MRAILAALVLTLAAALPALAAPAQTFPKLHFEPPRPIAASQTRASADSEERIDDFSSDITVAKTGDMRVKETISVHSEGRNIIHGIFRKFPTRFRDRDGHFVHVRFRIRDVQRDGKPEPYSTDNISGYEYVRIGDAGRELPRGDHTYLIVYDTDRSIGFFSGFDELYWNVTGTEWDFPIRHAEAIVHLPEGAKMTGHSEYTGKQGERGGRASGETRGLGYRFFTTAPLGRNQSLTFALEFSKGAVLPPALSQRMLYLLRDNAMTGAALIGLLALAGYFFGAWWKFGRDPARGVVIPLFAPPRNLSAASVRFVHRMAFDGKCFAAALVSMAVKGYLKIKEEAGSYVLTRMRGNEAALSSPEAAIAGPLFGWSNTVVLEKSNHEQISGAIEALSKALKREDEGVYFNGNRGWYLGGLGIFVASVAASLYFAESGNDQAFVIGWILAWGAALIGLLRILGGTWQTILAMIGPRLILSLGIILFASFTISASGTPLLTLDEFFDDLPVIALIAFAAQAFLAVAFHHLLKAPTATGAKIREQIDGFRMFLDTAEKDRLEKLHPPAVTPEVFEKFLPYAIALDAENSWSKKFEADAARAGIDPGQTYSPLWYSGSSYGRFGSGEFVSSLGGAIASASTSAAMAPGSSSGGGGGGFSGGGGGGGGGGGW